jgi:hypothetical protein
MAGGLRGSSVTRAPPSVAATPARGPSNGNVGARPAKAGSPRTRQVDALAQLGVVARLDVRAPARPRLPEDERVPADAAERGAPAAAGARG